LLRGINNFVRSFLTKEIPGIILPFSGEDISPYILSFIIDGISSDILIRHLEQKEIYLSSSSACSSKVKGENVQFSDLGMLKQHHKFVLRASFNDKTTTQEVETFCHELKHICETLKNLFKR